MATLGAKVCQELFHRDALKHIVPLLKISDVEVVHMALCLVQMILQHVPDEVCHSLGFVSKLIGNNVLLCASIQIGC
jgi:hypothetical protein